jgi:endo-beta-N-acetylglucosaminidase D
MVDVTIGGSASDNLSDIASTVFKVTDEYKTTEPAILDFNTKTQLEAWREGNDKDGRIYTISVIIKDRADNETTNSTTVICPHDQGE